MRDHFRDLSREGCKISERERNHPFRVISVERLAEREFKEKSRADAEISAVPRHDPPHNDTRSPSSMNAPIFPFNKLMLQCHSIFRISRSERLTDVRANRAG